MAEKEKVFYWLKLKKEFMNGDVIDFLMSQKGGANYVVLYQMLVLKTINTEGRLCDEIGELIIPYNIEKIQRECKFFDIDTIRVAIELYSKLGLIYKDDNGILIINEFKELVGDETYWAQRKRIKRGIGQELDNVQQPLISNISISNSISNNNKDSNIDIIKEIIDYLNNKAQTSYKYNSSNSKKHISARLNEKYTIEDFNKVIDNKCLEWLGTDFEKFLRPETLFGSKFESYLNQKTNVRKTKEDDFMDRYEIKQQQILKSLENE